MFSCETRVVLKNVTITLSEEAALWARTWLDALWRSGLGRVSWQVLHEFLRKRDEKDWYFIRAKSEDGNGIHKLKTSRHEDRDNQPGVVLDGSGAGDLPGRVDSGISRKVGLPVSTKRRFSGGSNIRKRDGN